VRALQSQPKEQLAHLFMKIDATSTGTVDWDEFTNHILLEQVPYMLLICAIWAIWAIWPFGHLGHDNASYYYFFTLYKRTGACSDSLWCCTLVLQERLSATEDGTSADMGDVYLADDTPEVQIKPPRYNTASEDKDKTSRFLQVCTSRKPL
jgi:hypothetical protein